MRRYKGVAYDLKNRNLSSKFKKKICDSRTADPRDQIPNLCASPVELYVRVLSQFVSRIYYVVSPVNFATVKSPQVKSAPRPLGEPNVRAETDSIYISTVQESFRKIQHGNENCPECCISRKLAPNDVSLCAGETTWLWSFVRGLCHRGFLPINFLHLPFMSDKW